MLNRRGFLEKAGAWSAAGLSTFRPEGLERLDEAAEVARVEVEARAQRPQVGAVRADLPQHPRRAKRPAAREVLVVESADALGDAAVERADLSDRRVVHGPRRRATRRPQRFATRRRLRCATRGP